MSDRLTATARLERLLALVPWVAERPDGVPVDEVCQRFEVSAEELVRDLDTVMMVGVHPFTPDTMIEAWIADDRVSIRYADTFARPLRLTPTEAVGLITAAAGVAGTPGADEDGALARAITKLGRVVADRESPGLEVDLGGADREVFAAVEDARRTRHQIEIDYAGAEDAQGHRRRIEPAQVFSDGGFWYVSGWCHRAEENRIFRMDRVLAVHETTDEFTHDVSDAPATVAFTGAFPTVLVEVDRASAWMVDSIPTVAREDRGDAVRIRLAVGSERWLARLLVRLGPAADVLEADPPLDPAGLAAEEAARIRARYG